MKKVAIALLIAVIVPCCIFASRGMFDFTVGVAASSDYKVTEAREIVDKFSIDKISFGGDVEMKLAFLALDGKVMYQPENKTIGGIASANLALDLFFLRIKAGLGYEYQYDFNSGALAFGNVNKTVTEVKDFKDACFDLNAGVDFLIGSLTVGAYATLPSKTSIAEGNWGDLFQCVKDGWKDAKLGMTVGIALF
jgi:hypothetical protein